MDLNFSKREKKYLKMAEDIVDKWRKILHLDPIWDIDVLVFNNEDMPGAFARVDTSTAEYFFATIEISYSMLEMKEQAFEEKMNEAAAHELIHILLCDFVRTAQLCAGDNNALQDELKYKYEQFTSRLQRSFIDLYEYKEKFMDLEEKIDNMKNNIREILVKENYPEKFEDLKKFLIIE